MIIIRKSSARGLTKLHWLESKHSFSFGHYYDPSHKGFGPLRVINEDIVLPGAGFDTHPHHNMEIVSYVLQGALAHKDSMGNGEVIKPGDIQRMSAGTGIMHSEFNHSATESVHLLQIWFLPNQQDITPSYEQQAFDPSIKQGKLALVMSPDGRNGTVTIHQDIMMYAGLLNGTVHVEHLPEKGRIQWVQMAKGQVNLNGETLYPGDGAAIEGEKLLQFTKAQHAEIILFDMAALQL